MRKQGLSVMARLHYILRENDRSMSRSIPVETREQKQSWWRTRLHLNEQLSSLLQYVDAQYLGPWRYGWPLPQRSAFSSSDTKQNVPRDELLAILYHKGACTKPFCNTYREDMSRAGMDATITTITTTTTTTPGITKFENAWFAASP